MSSEPSPQPNSDGR